jgi:NSS family neurotransmitter:Na+ symporter
MRERLSSRLGFLMLAAGCAVGLGNVWRFPFVVGANGGAAFVLVYFAFLLLFGFPVLLAELSVGRGGQAGIAGAFRALGGRR